MSRNFFSWIKDFFGDKETISLNGVSVDKEKCSLYFAELAIDRASSLIASSISKCEFKFFDGGIPTKGLDYWKWNIRPSNNRSANRFKYELAYRIIHNGECLVIRSDDGQYLIADDFSRDQFAFKNDMFTNVTIKDFTYNRSFRMDEVLYYRLENDEYTRLMDSVFKSYGTLITHAIKIFSSSGSNRFKAKLDSTYTSDPKKKEAFQDILSNQFKKFIEAENSVLPEYNGMEFVEFGNQKTSLAASEIIAIRKDMFDMVASSYRIPKQLLYGEVADIDTLQDGFIALCIEPITTMIANVNTSSICGYGRWINGTRFEVDTSKIKYFNLFKLAPNIEKLISSGFMSIDEVRDETSLPLLNTDESKAHFMTKNFSLLEDVLKEIQGEEGGEHEE